MSAEPGRKKAYGINLRWRVVYQRIGMNLTYDKIATNLNIAASTAYSIFTRFQQTGMREILWAFWSGIAYTMGHLVR